MHQAQRASHASYIKMASNENPFGPSPKAIKAMRAALIECNFYPENEASELQQELTQRHQVQREQILVTGGSTALLNITTHALLSPGLNAVTSERSFLGYSLAAKAGGGELIEVAMSNDRFDLDAVAAAINQKTRIVFLANPNNPTGTLVTACEVDRFLGKVPAHAIVVLDEAYYEFAQHFAGMRGVDYSHSLEYVRQGRNLVVLRTFSKAHGLAGVRVGYGIGPADVMSRFACLRTRFSVSVVAQAAALAALDDEAHTRQTLENNAEQAHQVAEQVSTFGCRVVPTWANFLYCELGVDAADVARRLQAESVLVRPLALWGAPTAIRVSVGTPEQNEVFVKTFKKVMETVRSSPPNF